MSVEVVALLHPTARVRRRAFDVTGSQVTLDQLQVVVDRRGRRLELMASGGHQTLEAQPHGPLRNVADGDDSSPCTVLGGQGLGHGLEPAPGPVWRAHRELHPEPFATGGPLLGPVVRRDRQPGKVLRFEGVASSAEQPVVGRVRDDRLSATIDREDGVAETRKDGFQPAVLLFEAPSLLFECLGLQVQVRRSRRELVIGRAQLVDARGQLLVERLELLVGCLGLLVEGLDLLAAGLSLLARLEHRLVREPKLGDERCNLVVRVVQVTVDRRRPLQPALRLLGRPSRTFGRRDVADLDGGARSPARSIRVRTEEDLDEA